MALEIFRLIGSVFVDTEKAEKSLKKTDKTAGGLGQTLVAGAKSVGKFALGVGAIAASAGAGIVALTETTREYRTEQGKLNTAFKTNKFTTEQARKTYEALNGVLGDSGQAVEAASHIAALAKDQETLTKWTQISTGVYATFGDSLPIEGLTEAANETAKTGALTGALADALNWAGVNEENFQKKLDRCSNEQQRQALITKTLTDLYSEAADAYRETNSEVIAANEAQDRLNRTMASVGAALEPAITHGKLLLAEVLTKATPYITGLSQYVIPWLVQAISWVVSGVNLAIQAAKDFLAWLRKVGSYATDKFQPILDDLSVAIEWVQRKLDPLIAALGEYFRSGQAAEDITNAIKSAIDFLADAYDGIKTWVEELPGRLQDIHAWLQENEQMLTLVGIALGTLTAATVAYNAALSIKNAGGVVAIAQMVAYEGGFALLVAQEWLYTTATTVATAATTAWGTAVAFLTSPITLTIAAIGALIAVGYLLIKNWDDVSAAGAAAWEWIVAKWEAAGEWFNTKVVQPIGKFFADEWAAIQKTGADVWEAIQTAWSGAGTWFGGIWESIKNAFSNVTEWFRTTFRDAWQAVKNVFSMGGKIFDGIKEGIAGVFTTTVNAIIRGINKVIAVPFNALNRALKRIRDISIMGMSPFSWITTFTVPKIPELEEGAVLKRGQVGLLEGNGDEAVVPLHNNKKWIAAVAREMETAQKLDQQHVAPIVNITVNVDGAKYRDERELAMAIAEIIQMEARKKAMAFA